MESGDQMPIVPSKLAEDYRARCRPTIATLTSKAGRSRWITAANTGMPLDTRLSASCRCDTRLSRMR